MRVTLLLLCRELVYLATEACHTESGELCAVHLPVLFERH